MNRLIATAVLALAFAMPAGATKPTPPPAQKQTQHQGQAQGQHQGQSQGQNAEANAEASGGSATVTMQAARTRDNTPDVALGGLFPSAVCMGVANAGVSAPGFGVGVGKSYRDEECDKRETARSFAALGYQTEALLILCSTEAARILEVCPAITPEPPKGVVIIERAPDAAKVEEQKKQVGSLQVK